MQQNPGQGTEIVREEGPDFLSYHFETSIEEAAASSLGQQANPGPKQTSIDLNFLTILANDPRKALTYARNIGEVNEAKRAIAELDKVMQKIKMINPLYTDISNMKQKNQAKTKNSHIPKPQMILQKTSLHLQAIAEAARPSTPKPRIDLVTDNELPDIDTAPAPGPKIPAPTKSRDSGFLPSSAKRGRGSRGGRGAATTG